MFRIQCGGHCRKDEILVKRWIKDNSNGLWRIREEGRERDVSVRPAMKFRLLTGNTNIPYY